MNILSSRRDLVLPLIVALIMVAGIGFVALRMLPGEQGTTASAVPIGGPFTLTNHLNEPVTEKTFAGKHMLIYFGYSFCPDICPTSLQTMAAAYDLLTAEEKAGLSPIYITVDPERDTVEAIAEYVALFHEDMVGLTGTLDQVKAAAKAYRVYFAKNAVEEGSDDYFVDHSSFYYLMGPDGRYVKHFGHDATEEKMAEGIQAAL